MNRIIIGNAIKTLEAEGYKVSYPLNQIIERVVTALQTFKGRDIYKSESGTWHLTYSRDIHPHLKDIPSEVVQELIRRKLIKRKYETSECYELVDSINIVAEENDNAS